MSSTGRFLTADPLGFASSPELVQSADLFGYANDSPLSSMDVRGMAPQCLPRLGGGCSIDFGVPPPGQSYEDQRRAMGEHWAADHAGTQRLQEAANAWWAGRSGRPADGDGGELVDASDARTAGTLEKPTEPTGLAQVPTTMTATPPPAGPNRTSTSTSSGMSTGAGTGTDTAHIAADDLLEIVVTAERPSRPNRRTEREHARAARREARLARRMGPGSGIYIAFPDYAIATGAGRIPYLGHAGVLLIRGNGATRYYEYGRYGGPLGKVQEVQVPRVKIDDQGVPTEGSLREALEVIALKSGNGEKHPESARIEGAFVDDLNVHKARAYVLDRLAMNDDPGRTPYSLVSGNTCNGFAAEVIVAGGGFMPPRGLMPAQTVRDALLTTIMRTPHAYAEAAQLFHTDVHFDLRNPNAPVYSR